MRHCRPAPPPRFDCVENLEAWRRYILDEITTRYQEACEALNVDGASLEQLQSILATFTETEARITESLGLMHEEIETLREMLNAKGGSAYTLKEDYSPATKNLVLRLEVK